MDELLAQCDAYFKQEGFQRLFAQMRKKFQSLGHFGGILHLEHLSDVEKSTLNGFLRKDLSKQDSLSISIKKIRGLLLDTKFADIPLETILSLYYKDDELISNRQKQQVYLDEQQLFFKTLLAPFLHTPAMKWITAIMDEQNGGQQLLFRRYDADKEKLKLQLPLVLTALNNLPKFANMKKRMPIFASEITGNPHAFDENDAMFPLLIQGICFLVDVPYFTNMDAEAKMNVLYEAGILKDDISSFTIVYNLYAYHEQEELMGWRLFAQKHEPLLLSLANLDTATEIHSEKHLFIVENPSVFSALLEYCKEAQIKNVSLICTYGQLRVASIQILDMLVQHGQSFYYAGDFDPEGLQIAQKLCQRYQQTCILWRYDVSDYQMSKSIEELRGKRLHKLASISELRLQRMKECLHNYKFCGYQEHLITKYKEDIRALSIQDK